MHPFPRLSSALWLILAAVCPFRATAVTVPGCQTIAPQQKTLYTVQTANLTVPANPFGVAFAFQTNRAFVSLHNNLGVLNTANLKPSLIHQIPMPNSYLSSSNGEGATGLTLTHDGCYALVAVGTAAVIVNTAKAVSGSAGAVVGALNGTAGDSAIEVIVTPDDEYAFVSQEYGTPPENHGDIEVFRLNKQDCQGNITGTYIGSLTLGNAVVGTALSPDGSILYATSEIANSSSGSSQGSLSVIDVETLKTNPQQAVISVVQAGCSAVRVAVPSDGKTVWVTARESNHLLAFDAAKLISDPSNALLTSVQVGTSPVGLIFAKNNTRILTADSNRFGYAQAKTGLSVVNVTAALLGKPAGLGRIPTGVFPREFARSRDGSKILVTDFGTSTPGSMNVQAINVATLP